MVYILVILMYFALGIASLAIISGRINTLSVREGIAGEEARGLAYAFNKVGAGLSWTSLSIVFALAGIPVSFVFLYFHLKTGPRR